MANPRTRRRGNDQRHRRTEPSTTLDLRITGDQPPAERPAPQVWWPLAAAGGALLSVVAGYLIVAGLLLVGWLSATDISMGQVALTAARIWLTSYFSGASVAGLHLTIAPLGLTALNFLVASGTAGFAASMARRAAADELSGRQRRAIVGKVSALFVLVYTIAVLAVSFAVATGEESARALIGVVLIAGTAALVGGARACEWHPLLDLPVWARAIPRAIAVGVLSMVGSGAVVLMVQLIRRREQVAALHDALGAGSTGGVLVLIVQLIWLPNLVIWCAAWAAGAGFSLGVGSMVTPSATQVGLLPSIPVLGAVPANGPGPMTTLWWLCTAVLAGALAAGVVLRARRRARFDETALAGGLAGLGSGLVLVLVAAASGGDLGTGRLVGLGPRVLQLAVMAPTLMGIAGVITGFAIGLLRPEQRELVDPIPVVRDEAAELPTDQALADRR